jgi:hypothetical protein
MKELGKSFVAISTSSFIERLSETENHSKMCEADSVIRVTARLAIVWTQPAVVGAVLRCQHSLIGQSKVVPRS